MMGRARAAHEKLPVDRGRLIGVAVGRGGPRSDIAGRGVHKAKRIRDFRGAPRCRRPGIVAGSGPALFMPCGIGADDVSGRKVRASRSRPRMTESSGSGATGGDRALLGGSSRRRDACSGEVKRPPDSTAASGFVRVELVAE